MQVQIGRFIKKENSTLRPSGLDRTLNVELKKDTSIMHPVFRIRQGNWDPDYNYVYVPNWGRYYFISDATYVIGEIVEVACSEDIGATWRDEIAASNLYVLRSAAEYDGYVVDNAYPAKVDYTIQETQAAAPWSAVDFSGGTYICGIVGKLGSGSVGSVTYWALDRSTLRSLLSHLMSSISFYQVSTEEISEELQKMLFNPLQYFVSCVWLPIDIGEFDAKCINTQISYGWWDFDDLYGRMITNAAPITKTIYGTLLPHPQTARGSYLNSAPFTRKFVRFLPFGTFELDPQFFPSNATPVFYLSVDIVSGAGVLRVAKELGDGSWASYSTIQAQVGVPVQLSQVSPSFANVSNGMGAIMGGAASGGLMGAFAGPGGVIAGGVIGALGAVGSALTSFIPALQSTGINGGLSGLAMDITITHYFSILVEEDRENHGRPLCKLRTLGALPGYQLIQEGDVEMSGTDSERAAVKALLEGGYFFE